VDVMLDHEEEELQGGSFSLRPTLWCRVTSSSLSA
jgi:hypothetical protein